MSTSQVAVTSKALWKAGRRPYTVDCSKRIIRSFTIRFLQVCLKAESNLYWKSDRRVASSPCPPSPSPSPSSSSASSFASSFASAPASSSSSSFDLSGYLFASWKLTAVNSSWTSRLNEQQILNSNLLSKFEIHSVCLCITTEGGSFFSVWIPKLGWRAAPSKHCC